MLSVVLNIKEEKISNSCLYNALTYITITPPCWLKPSADNGQRTTDNSLRFWRLLLKKLYSEFNLQKSYLTKFHKVCRHALRWCIAITKIQIIVIKNESKINCIKLHAEFLV